MQLLRQHVGNMSDSASCAVSPVWSRYLLTFVEEPAGYAQTTVAAWHWLPQPFHWLPQPEVSR